MTSNNTDIQFLKGVGEKRAELLKSKGIDTIGALLRFYPRDYQDWSKITYIYDADFGDTVCIKATLITPVSENFIRQNMIIYKFIVGDESGTMAVTLFNNKFLATKLNVGSTYLFYGKIGGSFIERTMSSPEIKETGAAGIHPIYPATSALSSKVIERLVKNAIGYDFGVDPLPEEIRIRNNLCDLKFAIENIHFPRTPETFERAKKRLVFEELFILQAGLLLLKGKSRITAGFLLKRNFKSEFEKELQFPLTGAQSRVIDECISDMMSGRLMNRLVQGDVGSGKTAVAAALCYISAKNGFQSALMAPTEILAEQHYKTLCGINEKSGIRCGILTGSLKKKEKDKVKLALKNGEIDVIVGTHALLVDDVEFNALGLVITDEQHRFGVAQRAKLAGKGVNPHTLVMSATPIPRTLALIIYGDLDISIIDEFPKGRQAIETFCVNSSYHQRVYNYIKKFLDDGRQGYIVCPLVEENEGLDITSAEEYYEKLRCSVFKNYSVGLLHGKMPAKEKDLVMHDFKDGKIQLLIATTVIEVGIDVPNATIMVIENAERFGLSQLHQLRGRIGRGSFKSSCVLISDSTSAQTRQRLNVIKNNIDGFKIADEDLKLRGPGDFIGNRQHGLPELKIADIFADNEILRLAGLEANRILKDDSKLRKPQNAALRSEIIALYKKFNEN